MPGKGTMEFTLPKLRRQEMLSLRLRALYEAQGYQLFRTGSFEAYDLYMQNRTFLSGEDIITFTGADGRLMALRPDVTLSIVKNTPSGQQRRLYYTENVFRRSRQTGEYREISQMGLEYIGESGQVGEAEVLRLALQSLNCIGECVLDLSHMGFIEAMLAPLGEGEAHARALAALQAKSAHGMLAAAALAGLDAAAADRLARLCGLSGPVQESLQQAAELAAGISAAQAALAEIEYLADNTGAQAGQLRLDFSIINDADYYNGLIFQGFVRGLSRPVLAGGRYDNLMRRFGKTQGGLGFALYLDALNTATKAEAPGRDDGYLNVALPKGRMGNRVYELFSAAGLPCEEMHTESRKLILEDAKAKVRYFLVKPSDVDIYVEHGAADIGVVGKDTLLESDAEVLELLDLGLGVCRFAVAAPVGFTEDMGRPLRVATKYPNVARRYFAANSRDVEIIELHGSIEIAPLLGLSDVIVDIVETGSTLRENNLQVTADVAPSSARLIANKAVWRFKQQKIEALVQKLEGLL